MTFTATPTQDLITGLAQVLNDAGVATLRTSGDYAAGETGIAYAAMPPDPARMVVLTAYGANSDQSTLTLGNQRVQVRTRGTTDPGDVDNLADAVFAALHGLTDRTFGAVHVVQCLRLSATPLGMDDQSRRWMRSDNYSVDLDWPGTTYRPA